MREKKLDPSEIKTPLSVVYDGTNDAIAEEIRFLKGRNKNGKLMFVNLAATSNDAGEYGVNPATMKEKLIVHDANGHVLTGNDALYAAHSVIGLGPWFEMCRLPGFMSVGTGIGPK